MLDFFSIFSKGGILLWCFKGAGLLQKEWEAFTPTVNELIKSVLLQERAVKKSYWEHGQLALKYKMDNEFELVFVIAYQKMFSLLYLDKLLDEIQLRFRDMFQDNLQSGKLFADFSGFTPEFSRTLRLVEEESKLEKLSSKKPKTFEESDKSRKTIGSMIMNKDQEGNSKPKKESKKSVKIEEKVEEVYIPDEPIEEDDSAIDEQTRQENLRKLSQKGKKSPKSPTTPKSPRKGKTATTWDAVQFGGKISKAEMANIDRTQGKPGDNPDVDIHLDQYVPNKDLVGKSATLGSVGYNDVGGDDDKSGSGNKSSGGGMFSMFTNLVGSKAITREDLEPVLAKLRDNLIGKNVASEVAASLTESVMVKLEGSVMGTFQFLERTVKDALTQSLMKLLTPKRRIDVLRDVMDAKENKRPYVISFCGVNGVGKSTNLAKICFWLIENKFSVLIAACDTFRAGAVEQLRTHTKRLNSLHPADQNKGQQMVQLYEKGYGKDAAGIAMEAINYARDSHIDVVLIDTAGRMQDNEPLMRALAKLISVNAPDLVLFVGEALVGNEAIDQLVKFNAALADHSSNENPHTIDGIVLTKFDTIDDKVGSAISMTYISGQPIVFVGTGQTYPDLKSLDAKAVVAALMK